MLQGRKLGAELVVGMHTDEEIAVHKGPTVMNLEERVAAVDACRFSTRCVPYAPYTTSMAWMTHYGCQYVVHGDDITSDVNGEDCYRFVKRAGRMQVVKRTEGISTTDLVGRMLNGSKKHFIHSLTAAIDGHERLQDEEDDSHPGDKMQRRMTAYAAAPNGKDPLVPVYSFQPSKHSFDTRGANGHDSLPQNGAAQNGHPPKVEHSEGTYRTLVSGTGPLPGQRVVYVDGGFDLFSSGHIAFLESVTALEHKIGEASNWFSSSAAEQRISSTGSDYGPAYVIAGVHDDEVINHHRGSNYPIMNIYERGLCVVQCQYVHAVVFSAPYTPSKEYLASLPAGLPDVVYHGPTAFMPSDLDPYADSKALGIFQQVGEHRFQDVNSEQIVKRILDKREEYEERQRKKGVKAVGEDAARKEEIEREKAATAAK